MSHMQLGTDNVEAMAVWARAIIVEEKDAIDGTAYPALNVQCGDEVKRASLGDYVIKHGDGTYDVLGPLAYLAHIKDE